MQAQRGSSLIQGHITNRSRGAGSEFTSFGLQYPSMHGHPCHSVVQHLVTNCTSPEIQKLNQIWFLDSFHLSPRRGGASSLLLLLLIRILLPAPGRPHGDKERRQLLILLGGLWLLPFYDFLFHVPTHGTHCSRMKTIQIRWGFPLFKIVGYRITRLQMDDTHSREQKT